MTLDHDHSYFVESTWGSGHLDSSTHQYKQELVPHYFLCQPEHMIHGHLPEDDQCQLLAQPLTLKQYLMLLHIYPTFFILDLHIISPAYSPKVDLVNGEAYGLVLIRTLNNNVELSGALEDATGNRFKVEIWSI
jgi:transglutaminase/protease-like cytokinesis protein 3